MAKKEINAWQVACDWYNEEQIYQAIQDDMHPFGLHRIPTDIGSREFAAWLTEQYRLAMAKGFQLMDMAYRVETAKEVSGDDT